KLFQQGEYADALRFLSSYSREDFPPHWAPPRPSLHRVHAPSSRREFLAMLEELSALDVAPWVRQAYFEMIRDALQGDLPFRKKEWGQFGTLLDKTPEGRAILQEMKSNPAIDRLLRDTPVPPPPAPER